MDEEIKWPAPLWYTWSDSIGQYSKNAQDRFTAWI